MITFKVEIEREDDGRWVAEVVELPGVLAYGETQETAVSRVQALALRVIAERLEPALGGAGGPLEDRVGSQAAVRLPGPRMLARIAKRTGLRPEDLEASATK